MKKWLNEIFMIGFSGRKKIRFNVDGMRLIQIFIQIHLKKD